MKTPIDRQIIAAKIIIAVLLLLWAYLVIEPFLYVLFGWGFFWDYSPDFVPLF